MQRDRVYLRFGQEDSRGVLRVNHYKLRFKTRVHSARQTRTIIHAVRGPRSPGLHVQTGVTEILNVALARVCADRRKFFKCDG